MKKQSSPFAAIFSTAEMIISTVRDILLLLITRAVPCVNHPDTHLGSYNPNLVQEKIVLLR